MTEHSHAMDIEKDVFKRNSKAIAKSLKASAEQSSNLKSTPFRSAMSMLNFYINRAGTNLTEERRDTFNQAKEELRKLYHKPLNKESAMAEKKTKQTIATKLSKARKARGSTAREKKLHTVSKRSALDRHAAAMKALKTKGIDGLSKAAEKAAEARDEEDQAA